MEDLKSEVVYISGLAKMFGKTEASIREGLRRRVAWLPMSFKIAGQHAWMRDDVIGFLRRMSSGAEAERPAPVVIKKPGRKRRVPPIFQG